MLKQFLQADPSQREGLASYAYAKSDPVDLADPSGNDPCNPGTGTGGYACQCPSGMQAVGGNVCGCPYNEIEFEGQCMPAVINPDNLLANPDGSCWPEPDDCLGDAIYQLNWASTNPLVFNPTVGVVDPWEQDPIIIGGNEDGDIEVGDEDIPINNILAIVKRLWASRDIYITDDVVEKIAERHGAQLTRLFSRVKGDMRGYPFAIPEDVATAIEMILEGMKPIGVYDDLDEGLHNALVYDVAGIDIAIAADEDGVVRTMFAVNDPAAILPLPDEDTFSY